MVLAFEFYIFIVLNTKFLTMNYQSDIRPSQINALFDKVTKNNYGKYLKKVTLCPIRGFRNESVSFEFPVTAIIGPNGGGKTSVLGACACAYISQKPGRFFAKSGALDDSMQNWQISYEMIDRTLSSNEVLKKHARFKSLKWSRDNMKREVCVFGVSRTVPATERTELQKCASSKYTFEDSHQKTFTENVIKAASRILGKDLSQYKLIEVDTNGKVTLLKGQTDDGKSSFSEFHFGAGESSIIRMVMQIEALGENSLILIEEIENGLHPVATQRMVEYLIEVAERKKAQAVFTTHSNDALAPLPPKAIWAAINNTLYQGKLDVASLRTITGQVDAALAIFVEDQFAQKWIETILAESSGIIEGEIEVHFMAGDGTAVAINKHHNQDPSTKFRSICIIDGDSQQKESEEDKVYRLPGECPERYIFDEVWELIKNPEDTRIGELCLLLQKKYDDSEMILKKIQTVGRTCLDAHLLYAQIGREIGFISQSVVEGAFLHLWARYRESESNSILEKIKQHLTTKSLIPASVL